MMCAALFVLFGGINSSITSAHAESSPQFKDIKPNHEAYEAVKWGIQRGLVQGYEDGTFRPYQKLTEAQFAIMAKRFYPDIKEAPFNLGNTKPDWADSVYASLGQYQVPLRGYKELKYRGQPIKRGLVAQFISWVHQGNNRLEDSIQFMFDKRISLGGSKTEKDILKRYGYNEELTRSQALNIFYRLSQLEETKTWRYALPKSQAEMNERITESLKLVEDLDARAKREAQKEKDSKPNKYGIVMKQVYASFSNISKGKNYKDIRVYTHQQPFETEPFAASLDLVYKEYKMYFNYDKKNSRISKDGTNSFIMQADPQKQKYYTGHIKEFTKALSELEGVDYQKAYDTFQKTLKDKKDRKLGKYHVSYNGVTLYVSWR